MDLSDQAKGILLQLRDCGPGARIMEIPFGQKHPYHISPRGSAKFTELNLSAPEYVGEDLEFLVREGLLRIDGIDDRGHPIYVITREGAACDL